MWECIWQYIMTNTLLQDLLVTSQTIFHTSTLHGLQSRDIITLNILYLHSRCWSNVARLVIIKKEVVNRDHPK